MHGRASIFRGMVKRASIFSEKRHGCLRCADFFRVKKCGGISHVISVKCDNITGGVTQRPLSL